MSLTEELAAFLVGIDAGALPESVRDKTRTLLLDHLGVALGGCELPWSKMLKAQALAEESREAAVLYGGGKASPALAALVNGTMAHGIELDDTHEPSASHPGAVVFAAALAVAQDRGCSGREVLAASVAGYEAMGRVGVAVGDDLLKRGLHPTALNGAFGAATATARLLGLDAATLRAAWGIVTSMASGTMTFADDPAGTMVKRLHAGWPAYSGVIAASLAARGYTGPGKTLDSPRGYIAVFAKEPVREALTAQLGTRWAVDATSLKPYACCRLFHSAIDAIRQSREEDGWTADEVESVVASGPEVMVNGHMEYRPTSVMAAQYSLPFTMAAAVRGDVRDPGAFSEAAMQDARTLSLAQRIEGRIDPRLEALFPATYAGRVRLTLRDGRTLEREVEAPTGSPANPTSDADLEQKFRLLSRTMLDERQQTVLLDAVRGFERCSDIRGFAALLQGDPQ